MRAFVADPELVAACGLYCGACRKHEAGSCPGCAQNEKAGWCKPRACCLENGYATCADCTTYADPRDCPKFDNPFSRVFGVLFNSDRAACVREVRRLGRPAYATFMAEQGLQTLPRRGPARPRRPG